MTPYTVHYVDTIAVLKLPSRIDSVTSVDFEQKLQELITPEGIILCDFSENTHISSLGLRVLLGTYKSMKKTGGGLGLCSLSPYIQEIFDISGFSRIFPIYSSESTAIPELQKIMLQKGVEG